jgi:hypothetical protein
MPPKHKHLGQKWTEPKTCTARIIPIFSTLTKYLTVVESPGLTYKHLGQRRTEPKAKVMPGLTIT